MVSVRGTGAPAHCTARVADTSYKATPTGYRDPANATETNRMGFEKIVEKQDEMNCEKSESNIFRSGQH